MIQNRSLLQPSDQYTNLYELKQYRKINSTLRKKIKEKDSKIQKLFSYIQDAGIQITPQSYISKSQIPQERSSKLALSDNRKNEKQNRRFEMGEENNIFRHPSSSVMMKSTRLPSLERKNKNIFQEDGGIQNPEKKGKVVKISIDRLKPLNVQEVKKRFLMKYQKKIDEQIK